MAEAHELPVTHANKAVHLATGSPSLTVLVVDDRPTNQEFLVSLLHNVGLQTQIADDGVSAIAKAKAHQPGLILMDLHMPNMSGEEAMQTLCSDPATSHIPVIAVSASVLDYDELAQRNAARCLWFFWGIVGHSVGRQKEARIVGESDARCNETGPDDGTRA